jgi:hypothetical protein
MQTTRSQKLFRILQERGFTGEMSTQAHQDGFVLTVFQQGKCKTYFRNLDLDPPRGFDEELLASMADHMMKTFQNLL